MPEQAPELFELMQNAYAVVDLQFQYWLTITFAAVVACFLARNLLGPGLRFALAALYALSVLQIVLVSLAYVEQAAFLSAALADLGVEIKRSYLPVIGTVRRLVVGLGTLAAIIVILRPGLIGEAGSPPLPDSQQE